MKQSLWSLDWFTPVFGWLLINLEWDDKMCGREAAANAVCFFFLICFPHLKAPAAGLLR